MISDIPEPEISDPKPTMVQQSPVENFNTEEDEILKHDIRIEMEGIIKLKPTE